MSTRLKLRIERFNHMIVLQLRFPYIDIIIFYRLQSFKLPSYVSKVLKIWILLNLNFVVGNESLYKDTILSVRYSNRPNVTIQVKRSSTVWSISIEISSTRLHQLHSKLIDEVITESSSWSRSNPNFEFKSTKHQLRSSKIDRCLKRTLPK